MNNTLYTQLAPLGFAEWLEKNEWWESIIALEGADKNFNIDSSIRTQLNALAFRWLREEKDIFFEFGQIVQNKFKYYYEIEIGNSNDNMTYGTSECYETYTEAEHNALNKALEIIKGGENGN